MGDELEQLDRIEKKLASLQLDAEDTAKLAERILPMFDDIFLQKLQAKDSPTIRLLSQHIAQVIEHSAQTHLPELSQALQRVISPILSREIEENKKSMIDILYPIMGGMISKYVSQSFKELLERINAKIEEGFSIGKYRRKIKATMTGVSESELLLKENAHAHINSLMVIHKETGLLIAEVRSQESGIEDAHMVASMASAIKDFINDWIGAHPGDRSEVEILSYGQETLYIESAGSVYIIAFLDAEPDAIQRLETNRFFAALLRDHTPFFQKFDGDDSAVEVEEVSTKMAHFLQQKSEKNTDEPSRGNTIRYLGWGVLAAAIIYGGYLLFGHYQLYRLEQAIRTQTGQRITIREANGKINVQGNVDTIEAYAAVMQRLRHAVSGTVVDRIHMPLDQMAAMWEQSGSRLDSKTEKALRMQQKQMEVIAHQEVNQSNQLMDLQKTIEQLKGRLHRIEEADKRIRLELADGRAMQLKLHRIGRLRAYVLQRLTRALGAREGFDRQTGSLDLRLGELFDQGKVVMRMDAQRQVDTVLRHYIETLLNDRRIRPYLKNIILEGYTDSSGSPEGDRAMSLKRAQAVRAYLVGTPWSKKLPMKRYLLAEGHGNEHPILIGGIEDKEASRRIRVKFTLDRQKIVDTVLKEVK